MCGNPERRTDPPSRGEFEGLREALAGCAEGLEQVKKRCGQLEAETPTKKQVAQNYDSLSRRLKALEDAHPVSRMPDNIDDADDAPAECMLMLKLREASERAAVDFPGTDSFSVMRRVRYMQETCHGLQSRFRNRADVINVTRALAIVRNLMG